MSGQRGGEVEDTTAYNNVTMVWRGAGVWGVWGGARAGDAKS